MSWRQHAEGSMRLLLKKVRLVTAEEKEATAQQASLVGLSVPIVKNAKEAGALIARGRSGSCRGEEVAPSAP
ncbi:MAG: hypothetical protein A3C13_02555 [Candidatus Lloydbacteria bacterium RIFCSPHIGHO2_02_FULL_50_11]|nr:MAG: hypothetical protein A3C13_02555 [Candidatus Lloydbacteria bacterium RIFCSPHIGHO2_02_FULL_50_11]